MFQSCIRRSRSCFQMSQSCCGISSRYLRVLWFIFSGQVCYLSACLGFDVVTPERVADIARSLLVLSATINIWGGAQGICDAEECRKLAVCFRSEAGSCSRYFEISQLSKSSLHKLRAFIEKFWDRNVYKVWEWRDCDHWRLLRQEWFKQNAVTEVS